MAIIYGTRVSPTLDLNFARNKSLVDTMTGKNLIDFSRVQSGTSKSTYFGADGILKYADSNEPRFDHDPVTGESLGLLVEEARTNSQIYSNNFATNWTLNQNGTAYVIPNVAQGPSGQYDASKLINDTGAYIQGPPFLTFSNIGFGMSATFDLSTKTVTTQGSVVSTSITEMGNGWFRCAFMPNTSIKYAQVVFAKAAESSVLTIEHWAEAIRLSTTGGLTGGILIWGAQVEAGTFPTSYIPTPATFVSRADSTQGASYYDANGIIQYTALGAARDNAYFPDENGVFYPAGLLLESAGTNYFKHSSDLGSSLTGGTCILTANQTTSPDNTVTATKVAETLNNESQIKSLTFIEWATPNGATGTANIPLVLTGFVKAGTLNRCAIVMGNGGAIISVNVNLTDGTYTQYKWSGVTEDDITVMPFPNGWYRVTIKAKINYQYNLIHIFPRIDDTAPTNHVVPAYQGNGDYFYAWGFQWEVGSYPTSYIPTSGSTVTRAADVSSSLAIQRTADVAQITGSNFSSWFNTNNGTFFSHCRPLIPTNNVNYGGMFGWSGNSVPNPLTIDIPYLPTSEASVSMRKSGTNGFNVSAIIADNSNRKLATSFDNLGFLAVCGGSNVNSITDAVNGAGALEEIGAYYFGGRFQTNGLNKHISRLIYYPQRLPDTTLQKLTR